MQGYTDGGTKKIEPLDEETVSTTFGSYKYLDQANIKAMLDLGVTEVFVYENPVGNSKPVPLVVLQGKKYVLKKVHDGYFEEYSKIQVSEHRPEAREVILNGKLYGLFEFKGDRVMDFTDREQLKQLCDIGIASVKRFTEFDPNPGNLIAENENVFYIDGGLTYTKPRTLGEAVLGNIGACIHHNIPQIMEKTLFLDSVLFIIQNFKDAFAPIQLSAKETPEKLIESELAWLLHKWSNKQQKFFPRFSQEVEKTIRGTLLGLFDT